MFDTNVCIDILRNRSESILKKVEKCTPGEIAISTITLAELQYGASRSLHHRYNMQVIADFCASLEILQFDGLAAEQYGRIRVQFEKAGKPIGPLDTLIAAHALSRECTLVTNNVREFNRISGLKIENWSR